MNLKIKCFHCWLDLLPSYFYKQLQKHKQDYSCQRGLKFVRSDHINHPVRLQVYGKNIAVSVMLFPQVIFLCVKKPIS